MNMDILARFIDGYREFRKEYTSELYAAHRGRVAQAQAPKVMMIACSDSRFNPAIVMRAGLGEVFMVNNVANLVPPYKEGRDTHHSTSAALEFAINYLKVAHVIVLGHSNCGGIKALMEGRAVSDSESYSFIGPWVDIAATAKERTLKKHPNASAGEQCSHCERESLLVSLENLQTFPWVKSALDKQDLAIHAWHFDVGSGDMEIFSQIEARFLPLLEGDKSQ